MKVLLKRVDCVSNFTDTLALYTQGFTSTIGENLKVLRVSANQV